jgi:cobaltochelatase CobN
MINGHWKRGLPLLLGITILFGCYWYYQGHIRPTRIAFINYSSFQLARIQKANDSRWVKLLDLPGNDIESKVKDFDALYVFGRGLQLTGQQLEAIRKAGRRDIPVFGDAVSFDQEVTNLKGDRLDKVTAYLKNGGGKNFKNLLHYTRAVLDGKKWFVQKVEEPVLISKDVLFHLDDEVTFDQVPSYEQYLHKKGFYTQKGAKIALLTSVPGPFNANRDHLDAMIKAFQGKGWNVYPIAGTTRRLQFLKQIKPDLVIEMPHGRISSGNANEAVTWLKKQNIPMLSPLSIFNLYEDWMADPKGLSGGQLTMSVVLPEIDGGVAPYPIVAQYKDEAGLAIYKIIPDRLEKFCGLMEKWLALRTKANKDKKIAIYYFKGPGLNSLVASNLEVVPAIYNVLKSLKAQGYTVSDLPTSASALEKRLQLDGAVLNPYAEGTLASFFKKSKPALVAADTFNNWAAKDLSDSMRLALETKYGKAPGAYMAVREREKDFIGVARISFGNIVLLPQPLPGVGNNTFKLVHGAKAAPPYPYIASYLWTRHTFHADAIVHFGTHGSLEFTPGKQVAMSNEDWSDALIGNTPHFYVYTMSNVGEAIIARRRSYATILSHLTAPFMQSGTYNELAGLEEDLHRWMSIENPLLKEEYGKSISARAKRSGLYHDLGANENKLLDHKQLKKLADLVEEIDNEKVNQGLYTLGKPYTEAQINQTVKLMSVDPVSYGLAKMDIVKGLVKPDILDDRYAFGQRYTQKAQRFLNERLVSMDTGLLSLVSAKDIARATAWLNNSKKQAEGQHHHHHPVDAAADTKSRHGNHKSTGHADSNSSPNADQEFAEAFLTLRNAVANISYYKDAIRNSTQAEMVSISNAFNGGYTSPSVGGDPVASPEALPTGRNMYSIDAEKTPSPQGWNVGVQLAEQVIKSYQEAHQNKYPVKVALTLWPGEFIQTDGAMLAEALYLMGVEPVRNETNKVVDVRLIPIERLKRPRIDVVVQTAGQFRDLAASRITLINKAVQLAAQADDGGKQRNFVQEGAVLSERLLKEKGFSPKEAKMFATLRVFGGIDGNYGTGIRTMVERGDQYNSSDEVADTYMHNMGAIYNDEHTWALFKEGLFEVALQHTDVVLQPRHSNTWGALSLDHVYEFAGGLNNVVRKITGKEPDVLFNDFRNPAHARVQNIKEAVWVESRSTILNPKYIKEMMTGGSSNAETFAETFRNTFGWNVMKSDIIDNELWNQLQSVYVKDRLKLGTVQFFKHKNPYALEEMTGVLMEAHRKGLWKATGEQLKATAALHADLAKTHGAGCSGFVCGNMALQKEMTKYLNAGEKQSYTQAITAALKEDNKGKGGQQMVLKKEGGDRKANKAASPSHAENSVSWAWLAGLGILVLTGTFVWWRRKNSMK